MKLLDILWVCLRCTILSPTTYVVIWTTWFSLQPSACRGSHSHSVFQRLNSLSLNRPSDWLLDYLPRLPGSPSSLAFAPFLQDLPSCVCCWSRPLTPLFLAPWPTVTLLRQPPGPAFHYELAYPHVLTFWAGLPRIYRTVSALLLRLLPVPPRVRSFIKRAHRTSLFRRTTASFS